LKRTLTNKEACFELLAQCFSEGSMSEEQVAYWEKFFQGFSNEEYITVNNELIFVPVFLQQD